MISLVCEFIAVVTFCASSDVHNAMSCRRRVEGPVPRLADPLMLMKYLRIDYSRREEVDEAEHLTARVC